MNEWLVWLANPLDDLAGWPRFVFVVLWQSTIIATLALLLANVARRPAMKAWVLLLGIAASFLAPLATTAVRAIGWGAAPLEQVARGTVDEFRVESPLLSQIVEGGANKARAFSGESSEPSTLGADVPFDARHTFRADAPMYDLWNLVAGIFAVAWLAASLVIGIRLVRGFAKMRSIVRRAEPCDNSRIAQIASRVAERFGIAPPPVLLCRHEQSPAVFGIRSNLVLVSRGDKQLFPPDGAFPASAWEAVLRHELAHVRRRDPLARAIVEVIVSTLPWPAMWLLRRKFYAMAEEACDDWAVFEGTRAVDLAALLTDYVSALSPNPIGNAMDASDTKRRILRLLSTNEARVASPAGRRRGVLAAVAVVAIAAVAAAQRPAEEAKSVVSPSDSPSATATYDSKRPAASEDERYVIEPPDVLVIEVAKLVPKSPRHVDRLDTLRIGVDNALVEAPIQGSFKVDASGNVDLGRQYGKVDVIGMTEADATAAVDRHLRAILREPRVTLTIEEKGEKLHIEGNHLVGPDGTMNLGVFGSVRVSGLTLDEVRRTVEEKLATRFEEVSLSVDVFAYNSKVYYVIEDNHEGGDRVTRLPITGNETVLDALANVESLRIREGTELWVARTGKGKGQQKLVVDWDALVRGADTKTNYQLLPGDRVFVAQPDAKPSSNGRQRR